jgi:ethanolamine utilization protein EutQ (cupin superfamily)
MGICESDLNNNVKGNQKNKITSKRNLGHNMGTNFFSAPIDTSANNDNIYVDKNMSQTMTMDMSQSPDNQKPPIYQYKNKYRTNGLQKSIDKASLVKLGGQGNSINSIIKNSEANINSIYSSKMEDTGYESSLAFDEEMIIDGKMNEDLVKKSTDKNTINNYNEFIKKKEDNENIKPKILEYYHKNSSNINKKNMKKNGANEVEDELSRISNGNVQS